MAKSKGNSVIGRFLIGPALFLAGVVALWENEGRFDFSKAAQKTQVIQSPGSAAPGATISLTDELNTQTPIRGGYVTEFVGFNVVYRRAQIYSWTKERRDDRTVWELDWNSSVEGNSRNGGIVQTLVDNTLYPVAYALGSLSIDPVDIHFVDDAVDLPQSALVLSNEGRSQGLTPNGNYLYKLRDTVNWPQLGDERVGYTGVRNQPRTTYFGTVAGGVGKAKQFEFNESFLSDLVENDGILHHLVNGDRATALATMASYMTRLVWIVRGAGTAAIIFGIAIAIGSFINLLYRIPLLGRLVETGVFLISVVLGLTVALLVIFSSVVFHHPIIVGLPLAGLIAAIVVFRRQSKTASTHVEETLQAQQAALAASNDLFADGASTAAEPARSVEMAELIFGNLAKIALTDGELDDKERKFIMDWGAANGLESHHMAALLRTAGNEGSEIRATSRDDLILLTCVAMADGTLSTRELSRLLSFGKKLGMSAKDVREIVIGVETGNLVSP